MAFYDNYRPMETKTSVFYAFDYLIGLVVFGFIYGILNMIIPVFANINPSDDIWMYANFMWGAALFVYLIFGPFWFWNKIKEKQ